VDLVMHMEYAHFVVYKFRLSNIVKLRNWATKGITEAFRRKVI